jgi:hypothetical protein
MPPTITSPMLSPVSDLPLLIVTAEVGRGWDGKGVRELEVSGRANGEHRAASFAHYLVGFSPGRLCS